MKTMRAGFLSLMRGQDGCRLGMALAAVLAVAALITSVNVGLAAGGSLAGVICRVEGANSAPMPAPLTAGDHGACCLAGHSQAPAVPPERGVVLLPSGNSSLPQPAAATNAVMLPLLLGSEGPRGPPLAI
jgi:hypothetical protein